MKNAGHSQTVCSNNSLAFHKNKTKAVANVPWSDCGYFMSA